MVEEEVTVKKEVTVELNKSWCSFLDVRFHCICGGIDIWI